jgi:hypothetical protein
MLHYYRYTTLVVGSFSFYFFTSFLFKTVSNLWSYCFCLPSAGITGLCYHGLLLTFSSELIISIHYLESSSWNFYSHTIFIYSIIYLRIFVVRVWVIIQILLLYFILQITLALAIDHSFNVPLTHLCTFMLRLLLLFFSTLLHIKIL